MDSRELGQNYKPKTNAFVEQFMKQFSDWCPLNEQGIGNAPNQLGAYVLRRAKGHRFARLRGESDIMYISSAAGKRGIRWRLGDFYDRDASNPQTCVSMKWLRNTRWRLLGAFVTSRGTLNIN